MGRKMLREFHFAGTRVPLKALLNPSAAVPFPVDATFILSVNLLAQHAARQRGTLRSCSLHFWLVPVCALPADPVPHTISWDRQREQQQWPPFNRWSGDRLLEPVKVAQ